MAEQEEDVQSPTQLRVLSIVKSPPQLYPHLLYKQPSVHPIWHVPPQPLMVQWPTHVDIGPQPLLQEVIHVLVHTPLHPSLPHPWWHVPKQPPLQSRVEYKLLPEHRLEHVDAQLRLQLEPHELEPLQ